MIRYCISLSLGHVNTILPYISDNGVLIPERAIFSWLINVGVILQIIFGYVRFDHVTTVRNFSSDRTLVLVNRVAFFVGLGVSFGLTLIGNFQLESDNKIHSAAATITPEVLNKSTGEDGHEIAALIAEHQQFAGHMQKIHWSGAFFTFVGGIVWMAFQSWITKRTSSLMKNPDESCCRCRYWTRVFLTILSFFFMVLGIVLALVAATDSSNDGGLVWDDSYHSMDSFRGRLSLTAAFCEWMVALLSVVFTLTFVPEYRHLHLGRPKVVVDWAERSSTEDNGNVVAVTAEEADLESGAARRLVPL